MSSTYTTRLRLEKQGAGDNDTTWGNKANTVFDLIDDAISGMATINTTGGSTTLTSNNSAADEARNAILKVAGVLVSNATLVIPAVTKIYVVKNTTSGAFTVTVKTSGGTGVEITQGEQALIFCDGTDCYSVAAAGAAFLSGSGAPGGGDGDDGDFYFDTAGKAIYGPKAGGAWPAGTSLTGAAYTDLERQNAIDNATFQVAQRSGTNLNACTNGTFFLDRWCWVQSGVAVVQGRRVNDVPTFATASTQLNWSARITVNTADTSIAAGDYYAVRQAIAGSEWQQFHNRALTLSFNVKSPKTGVHCIAITNFAGDRSFVAEYTVSTANTWEHKTVSITAINTGTWSFAGPSVVGAYLYFTLACGATKQSTTGWTNGNYIATSNQVNAVDNAFNDFMLSGIALTRGTVEGPFPHVPYEADLDQARLYYRHSFPVGSQTLPVSTTTYNGSEMVTAYSATQLCVTSFGLRGGPMAAAPTMRAYSPNTGTPDRIFSWDGGVDHTGASYSFTNIGNDCYWIIVNGLAAGSRYNWHWTATCEI